MYASEITKFKNDRKQTESQIEAIFKQNNLSDQPQKVKYNNFRKSAKNKTDLVR